MDGPEGCVTRIEALLRERLPAKLAELRVRYGVVDNSLEDVTRFLTTEPPDIAIDRPPMIVIVEQESDSLQGPVKAMTDGYGGSLYAFRYRVGIFAWARGTTYATTARARQRYGLAVREVLLQTPGIGDPEPGHLVIDPLTIVETYSGVATSQASREIIAATALVVEYISQEHLLPKLPGVAATGIQTGVGVGESP
jgi:hypothetical protein